MIKSVSRSTGLSSVYLIIALIVPLIQCSSIENEESSIGRFKRNTLAELGSKASASAESSAESFVVPIFTEKTGKPGGWPGAGAGGPGGWPGAGAVVPGGWPGAGGPGGWAGAGAVVPGGWPGAGGPVGWPGAGAGSLGGLNGKIGGWGGLNGGGGKKVGSFGNIIGQLVPNLDETFIPLEKTLTFDAFKPVAGIVDGAASSLFGGFAKGFGGKGGFEKAAGPEIDFSKVFSTYLAPSRGRFAGPPNVEISAD